MKDIAIRTIKPTDNKRLAEIIREVLTEFGGNRKGTAYYDFDTDYMFDAYQGKKEVYYVTEVDGELVGGSGIKLLTGNKDNVCELQKLYISSKVRGLGIGKNLMQKCLGFAQKSAYDKCYLETFSNMDAAIGLYKKFGFKNLDKPLGDTGHGGCDVWLMKDL